MAYEFAEIFKRAGIKGGWTVSIRPTSPAERALFDKRVAAIKKFISEIDQARQAGKNSTLHFGQKITTQPVCRPKKSNQYLLY